MVLWGASTHGAAAGGGKVRGALTVDGRRRRSAHRPAPSLRRNRCGHEGQFDCVDRDKAASEQRGHPGPRLKEQITARTSKSTDAPLKAAGDRLAASLTSVEEAIYQTKNQSGQDPLNFPIRINNRIASLNRVVNNGDGKPIGAAYDILTDVTAELKVETDATQVSRRNCLRSCEAKRAGWSRSSRHWCEGAVGDRDDTGENSGTRCLHPCRWRLRCEYRDSAQAGAGVGEKATKIDKKSDDLPDGLLVRGRLVARKHGRPRAS